LARDPDIPDNASTRRTCSNAIRAALESINGVLNKPMITHYARPEVIARSNT